MKKLAKIFAVRLVLMLTPETPQGNLLISQCYLPKRNILLAKHFHSRVYGKHKPLIALPPP